MSVAILNSPLTLVLLNCFHCIFRHLQLELLTQFPVPNDKKYFYFFLKHFLFFPLDWGRWKKNILLFLNLSRDPQNQFVKNKNLLIHLSKTLNAKKIASRLTGTPIKYMHKYQKYIAISDNIPHNLVHITAKKLIGSPFCVPTSGQYKIVC